MKKYNLKYNIAIPILGMLCIVMVSCERGYTDEVEIATFNPNGEIFTDAPVGLTDEFFTSFDPAVGANTEGFGTDDDVSYQGTSSIRIDVPTPNDPNGGFIGGIFLDRGAGRDLTRYDALTFWVKGSTTATVGTFGFGTDFEDNEHAVTLDNVQLSTDWRKVIIPIPEPSRLVQEKGMFLFAAGTQSTNGVGYTFWMDEMRFERLGTLGQPRPAILGGQDQTAQINIDTSLPLSSLSQTYNLPTGQDVTVSCAPAYFDFETSNPFVASVDENGVVTVDGPGEVDPDTGLVDNTAVITAFMGGVLASGSLTVQSVDIDVISIFSDLYANVPVDNYNGFYFDGFQTTLGGAVVEDGNNIIDYTVMNFVAIEFYGREGSGIQPVDASEMSMLHIDVRVNENVDPSDFFRIEIFNNFTEGNQVAGSYTISGSELASNDWVEFDIPLSSFPGLTAQDALGAFIFVTDGTIANVSLDNIYFYNEN
ncbi:carbohydrate-binding protein [Winogradskyella poriferorum]|uniref:carbohydrate-binding protein n=1 Tax=Winogradskyella poriferorum TaxID=307627 RepID=UPI003D650D66